MRLHPAFALLPLALAVTALATPTSVSPADDPQPLKVTAELIGQRYCPSNEKTFTVIFKFRMHFVNQTDRKLIVHKNIGTFIRHIVIASDAKNLSAGTYEYDIQDLLLFGQIPPETPEQFKTPGPNFAILNPGESLQNDGEYQAISVGALPGLPANRGDVPPGNHVIELWIWPWYYHADPEKIHTEWESFGDLVYKAILAGPLPFTLPPDPKMGGCN
jgi:hypothetical protein